MKTRLLPWAALASLGLCGCAGLWDDVTSRNFHLQALFVKPDPLVVLRDSTDGDDRAKAFRALQAENQRLKEAIERAWDQAGIPTFLRYLRTYIDEHPGTLDRPAEAGS